MPVGSCSPSLINAQSQQNCEHCAQSCVSNDRMSSYGSISWHSTSHRQTLSNGLAWKYQQQKNTQGGGDGGGQDGDGVGLGGSEKIGMGVNDGDGDGDGEGDGEGDGVDDDDEGGRSMSIMSLLLLLLTFTFTFPRAFVFTFADTFTFGLLLLLKEPFCGCVPRKLFNKMSTTSNAANLASGLVDTDNKICLRCVTRCDTGNGHGCFSAAPSNFIIT